MTEHNLNVTLDLNEMLQAYNKPDFMEKVFKNVLKERPEIFTQAIQSYVLKEIITSDAYDMIRDGVLEGVKKALDDGSYTSGVSPVARNAISDIIKDCVNEKEAVIYQKVTSTINDKMTKENISKHISDVVEKRVLTTLGEVCDGCGCEYY